MTKSNGKCLETGETFQASLKVSGNRKKTKSLEKCLETGETFQAGLKLSRNRKMTKYLGLVWKQETFFWQA